VEENQLLGGKPPLRNRALGGVRPVPGFRPGAKAEEATHDRSDRVLPLADAEIEHQAAMALKALGLDDHAHLFDEARLADAGLPAPIDDLADLAGQAGGDDRAKLLQLGLTAHERAAIGWARLA
jgi:hypothetical protein